MGAERFETESNGKDLDEAFTRAVDAAFYDYGHAGYTGTICEKPGAYLLPNAGPGVKAYDVMNAIIDAEGWDNPRAVWPDMKPEFVEQQKKYYEQAEAAFKQVVGWFGIVAAEKIVKMSDDKWDDAVAIELTPDECPKAAEKDDDRWFLFFGWASS